MKVIVESDKVETRSGISQKGKPYTINEQRAYVDLGKRYPVEFKINLDDNQPAWQPGEYDIDFSASAYVDRFDSLSLSSNLQLVNRKPLVTSKAA